MKEIGGEKDVELRQWADWLTMDISADMTYNRQMNQMKDGMQCLSPKLFRSVLTCRLLDREELSSIRCRNQGQPILDDPGSFQKVPFT